MRFRRLPFWGRVLTAIWAVQFSLAGIAAWAGDHGQANTSALRDASEESNLLQEWSGDSQPLIPDRTPSAKVQLKEGDNPERRAPGSAEETAVKPAGKRAFGFLNGRPAAAVVLITDPGVAALFTPWPFSSRMRTRGSMWILSSWGIGSGCKTSTLQEMRS